MAGFGLEVVEHTGHRKRTALTAEDWDELAEKIAAKTGRRVSPEDLLTDGGED